MIWDNIMDVCSRALDDKFRPNCTLTSSPHHALRVVWMSFQRRHCCESVRAIFMTSIKHITLMHGIDGNSLPIRLKDTHVYINNHFFITQSSSSDFQSINHLRPLICLVKITYNRIENKSPFHHSHSRSGRISPEITDCEEKNRWTDFN